MVSNSARLVKQPYLLLKIFSPEVLVGIFLINLLATGVILLITLRHYRKPINFESLTFIVESLRFTFSQISPKDPKLTSVRVLTIPVVLVVLVVTATYNGAITSYLALPL
ncbi:Ionotropic receptor 207, partial [Hyalella azteca]